MQTFTELQDQVYSTAHAPRKVVVAYLKELVHQAKNLPPDELVERRDYTDPAAQTEMAKGEAIASEITGCFIQQAWIDQDTADDLEEIGEIASQLEIDYDHPTLWQELFNKIDSLS